MSYVRYKLPELRLEGLMFNRRHANDFGIIVIGDKCDVYAESASVESGDTDNQKVVGTVVLDKVSVYTTLAHLQDLPINELRESVVALAQYAIEETYESIEWEAFVPQRRAHLPTADIVADLTPPKVERHKSGVWVCYCWSAPCKKYIPQTERATEAEAIADMENF